MRKRFRDALEKPGTRSVAVAVYDREDGQRSHRM